jgi:hypothetical protein
MGFMGRKSAKASRKLDASDLAELDAREFQDQLHANAFETLENLISRVVLMEIKEIAIWDINLAIEALVSETVIGMIEREQSAVVRRVVG